MKTDARKLSRQEQREKRSTALRSAAIDDLTEAQ